MRLPNRGARVAASAALVAALLTSLSPPVPAVAAAQTEAAQIISIAKAQIGDPWKYGATGPSAFDCSGFVIYVFRTAGDLALIGNGNLRSASALYQYFRGRGKTSRTTATPGDLVIYGNGSHVGIYLGGGLAISTLNNGVRVHGVKSLTLPFTTYLRTGVYQLNPVVPPTPTPAPKPAPKPPPLPVGAVVVSR